MYAVILDDYEDKIKVKNETQYQVVDLNTLETTVILGKRLSSLDVINVKDGVISKATLSYGMYNNKYFTVQVSSKDIIIKLQNDTFLILSTALNVFRIQSLSVFEHKGGNITLRKLYTTENNLHITFYFNGEKIKVLVPINNKGIATINVGEDTFLAPYIPLKEFIGYNFGGLNYLCR